MKFQNEEINILSQIFNIYFSYNNSSSLVRHICKVKQDKDEKTVYRITDSLIQLRNFIIRGEIAENENPIEVISFV